MQKFERWLRGTPPEDETFDGFEKLQGSVDDYFILLNNKLSIKRYFHTTGSIFFGDSSPESASGAYFQETFPLNGRNYIYKLTGVTRKDTENPRARMSFFDLTTGAEVVPEEENRASLMSIIGKKLLDRAVGIVRQETARLKLERSGMIEV